MWLRGLPLEDIFNCPQFGLANVNLSSDNSVTKHGCDPAIRKFGCNCCRVFSRHILYGVVGPSL